jgi:uncharacterized protein (DUF1330 family)
MAKAYWVAHVTVLDPSAYAEYASGATAAFARYGGRTLARGGKAIGLEGELRARNVIVEFDSIDAAMTCYNSAEYQAARKYRESAARIDLILLENSDPAISPEGK